MFKDYSSEIKHPKLNASEYFCFAFHHQRLVICVFVNEYKVPQISKCRLLFSNNYVFTCIWNFQRFYELHVLHKNILKHNSSPKHVVGIKTERTKEQAKGEHKKKRNWYFSFLCCNVCIYVHPALNAKCSLLFWAHAVQTVSDMALTSPHPSIIIN